MKSKTMRLGGCLILLTALFCLGCGRARAVGRPIPIDTLIEIGEPAYITENGKKSVGADHGENPSGWHRRLLVTLAREPAGTEALAQAYSLHRGPAYRECTQLMKRLRETINANRPDAAEWDVLEMRIGKPKPQRGRTAVVLTVGLRALYGKHAEIVFEKMPLDLCVLRMAKWAGLQDAQAKGYNPKVWWRKENVSVRTAMDEILRGNGFERRYAGVEEMRVLYPDEYASPEEFLKSATGVVLDMGRSLESGIPTVIVLPRSGK
jgi:hypothetical protein